MKAQVKNEMYNCIDWDVCTIFAALIIICIIFIVINFSHRKSKDIDCTNPG